MQSICLKIQLVHLMQIYGERERELLISVYLKYLLCSNDIGFVQTIIRIVYMLFHSLSSISLALLSLYLYLVRFICQDNFSRYLIFLSKLNFNFGVTYLFVRGEALRWHIHPSPSICVKINAEKKTGS